LKKFNRGNRFVTLFSDIVLSPPTSVALHTVFTIFIYLKTKRRKCNMYVSIDARVTILSASLINIA